MAVQIPDLTFFQGKRVFITGHTGFKGSWLCTALTLAGAEVFGFALPPAGAENLYMLAEVEKAVHSIFWEYSGFSRTESSF